MLRAVAGGPNVARCSFPYGISLAALTGLTLNDP